MIVLLRIDDRLLHGQVAYSWRAALSYDAIVIANDAAAGDELRKKAFKMARPEGVKIATRTITEAAALTKDERLAKMRVFVICGSPKDAYQFYQHIAEKPVLNIGGMQSRAGTTMLAPAVYFAEDDYTYTNRLVQAGVVVEIQEVPEKKAKPYSDTRSGT